MTLEIQTRDDIKSYNLHKVKCDIFELWKSMLSYQQQTVTTQNIEIS